MGYSIYRFDDVPRVELLAIETELLVVCTIYPLWLTKDKMTQEIELTDHHAFLSGTTIRETLIGVLRSL